VRGALALRVEHLTLSVTSYYWRSWPNCESERANCIQRQQKKRPISPPPPMADVERVTTLKILGVTIANTLSISEHVCEFVKSYAQSQYALRILQAHRLSDSGLHTVFSWHKKTQIKTIIFAPKTVTDAPSADVNVRRRYVIFSAFNDDNAFVTATTDADATIRCHSLPIYIADGVLWMLLTQYCIHCALATIQSYENVKTLKKFTVLMLHVH